MTVKKGQLIKLSYEGREFEVIVIDPNGIGEEQPSLGFGLGMMDKHAGLPQSTASGWIKEGHRATPNKCLETPTGKVFEVIEINGLDGNQYSVLEISNWVSVAGEALKAKGKRKVSEATRDKLIDFLTWFAIKGFYADAYTVLKGAYTAKDNRVLTAWMEARIAGKRKRNKYTDFLASSGCTHGLEYAYWTNYVYEGLFKKTAREMKQIWEVVEGNQLIARNYIPEAEGLKTVAYCEDMTVELFVDSLEQAHNDAINYTKRKFFK